MAGRTLSEVVPRPRPVVRPTSARSLPLLLLAATALAFLLRLALALPMDGPLVVPDELGYLGQVRWLTGDDSTRMTGAPYYNIGYPLLLVPAALLGGDDPERFWALLRITNSAIGASLVPLLAVLLRRTLGTTPRLAVIAAFVASCAPGFVLPAGQGWAEIAVPPAFLLWLLAVSEVFRRPTWLVGALAGAAAAATWSVHARVGLPALVATGMVVVWARVRGRLPVPAVLGTLGGAVAAVAAVAVLQARAFDALWGASTSKTAEAAGVLLDPASAVAPFTAELTGTLWNGLLGTVGIAVLGLVALAGAARRPGRAEGSAVAQATAATALLGALGLWVMISLAFIPATRADQFLHGRYVESVLPLPLAAGVVLLARVRSTRRLLALGGISAALVVVSAVTVRLLRGDLLETALFYPFSTSGVVLFSLDPVRAQLETATAVGLAVGAVVFAVAAVRRWAGVAALTVVLLTSTIYTAAQVYWPLDDGRYQGWEPPPPLPGAAEVAASTEPGFWFVGRGYHFWMPDVRIVPVDLAEVPDPDQRYVLAGPLWPGGDEPGARRLWVDNSGTVALFDRGTGTTARSDR